jgi:hypothetical protein
MEEIIKNNVIIFFLTSLVTGFIAGIGAYKTLLAITNQTTVIKGTYVLKSKIVGKVLRDEVLTEIRKLIEIGKELDLVKNPDKGEAFITRVDVFVRNLDLPKERDFGGKKMSNPAYMLHLLIMENKFYGYGDLTINQKVQRVVGILQGLEASFISNSGIQD